MPDSVFELDLPPGLDSDDSSFSAKGRWYDAVNMRFWNGRPQLLGEAQTVFADTGAYSDLFPFTRDSVTYLAIGAGSVGAGHLYLSANGASPADRSAAGFPSDVPCWSFGTWGTTLLVNPTGGTLYEQSDTENASAVPAAPDQITAMLVTPQRQVVAYGCNEEISGAFNERCIRWSDLEDYNDWTTTATNNAGEHILDGSGPILAGVQVGESEVVLTKNEIYLQQYIGDPGQTYSFTKIANNCGIVGPKAYCVSGQTLYWFGSDLRLRVWQAGAAPQIVPCPMLRSIQNELKGSGDALSLIRLCFLSKYEEVWIQYQAGAQLAAVVSTRDGSWFKVGAGISPGGMVDSALLNSVENIGSGVSFRSNTFGLISGRVTAMECDRFVVSDYPTEWSIRSADQYIESGQRRVMIKGIIPDFATNPDAGGSNANPDATVSVTLYMKNRPQSAPVIKGPYSVGVGATKKAFRASGKLISVEFSGTTADVNRELRIGKCIFPFSTLGER